MKPERLFSRYSAAGYKVALLHHVGTAAVARISSATGTSYACRWKTTFGAGTTPQEAILVARANRMHKLAESDTLHARQIKPEWLAQQGLPTQEIADFCVEYDLHPWQSYSYGHLRSLVFGDKEHACRTYGKLLTRAQRLITSTNPA